MRDPQHSTASSPPFHPFHPEHIYKHAQYRSPSLNFVKYTGNMHEQRALPPLVRPRLCPYRRSAGVSACTMLVPSLKRVRKMRLAFWNMPSLRLTTMNCEPLKRILISRPMFCVCDRSSAASTSSRMYMGAGLNCSSAMIRDSAMSDLTPVGGLSGSPRANDVLVRGSKSSWGWGTGGA